MGSSTFSNGLEKENLSSGIHLDLGTQQNMNSQGGGTTGLESNMNKPMNQKSANDKERKCRSETDGNVFNEKDLREGFGNTGDCCDGLRLIPDSSLNAKEIQLKNWENFWCNTEDYKSKHIQPFHFTSGLEEIKEPVMDLNISTSPYKGQRPNSAPTECSAATTTITKIQLEVSFLKTNLLTYIKKEIDICLSSVAFFDDAVQIQKKFLECRDIDLDEEYELKILGEILNELNFFHMQENSLLNRELAVRKFSNQPENQHPTSIRSFRNPHMTINTLHSPQRELKRNGKSFEESYEYTNNSSNFWGEKAEFQNSINGGTPYCFSSNNLCQTKPFMTFGNQTEASFERNPDYKQRFNSGRSIQNGMEARSYGEGLSDSYQKGYAEMTKSFGNVDLNRMSKRGNETTYNWSRN
ncbi:Spo74p [Saccharomyces cerevisiae x Saccharomyces kudriavzevii VIN7]|uniref:Spo74p n=1 Tax=Saccharomyces cerevisiae x Saccharomyces kudriavzevii (strain VIN7) TaxID=1095631 RepID=H0GUL8_SACCK|nr:Spo74p [Saccharomyces cerevisiae x Saccharomyces kudriavzevii VIN7]CAI5268719.1 AIS_HP2_G0017610.mRNA.1.CDS.1 [Saccharomyces cerevisiae]CAI6500773.1 AIS_HP2_G0017610.mRNA.1.CDS.1 [Saccharomyces cerevisiae]